MNSKEYVMPDGKKAVFEYDHDGIGKVTIEAMDMLMGLIADGRKHGEWIPCSERLPSSSGKCLVTEGVEQKTTSIGFFSAEHKRFYSALDVIAWMPLPEPYCGADMREREGE